MKKIVVFLLLCLVQLSFADEIDLIDSALHTTSDSLSEEQGVVITIERLTVEDSRLNDTLLVMLKSTGAPVAGFDFKFGIDNPMVDIVEILPGEIYDSCRWEYFTARQINTANREDYPPILWQTVALAEMVSDTVRPLCFGFDREASLLKLVVSNEHILEQPDTTVPVFFFWEDCTDNTISGQTGNILLISRQVFDYFGQKPKQGSRLFPTRTGAPNQCIDPARENHPRRRIDYHNGGIKFRLRIEPEPEDTTSTR
ncbi:MAG: hypothetical protein DRP47_09560 [Candidatus Zixiibacteriota bacterium]|nr:MAG: hypothetical protein DRP47_09560 [candidate division Zixibacteria bacterium]